MARLVVLVLSDPKDQRKVVTGMKFAKMAKESGELDDVRLIISAQAIGVFTDKAYKDLIGEVTSAVPSMACRMNADGMGIAADVEASGVPLAAVGKELIRFIKEGYEVISF